MSPPPSHPCISQIKDLKLMHCLAEKDHELLTSRGFKTLHELREAWGGPLGAPPADPAWEFASRRDPK